MIRKYSIPLIFILLTGISVNAQKGISTVGLQFKPIIPVSFFDEASTVTEGDISAELSSKFGYTFGMNVRRGISDLFALEIGINYVQRNYNYSYMRTSQDFEQNGDITFISYEIPVMALFYVRLGEQSYLNAAAGVAADMYPSDVETTTDDFRLYIFRKNWIQGSVMASLGCEFRTQKSGYFYIGATYNRPFNSMAEAEFTHYDNGLPTSVRTEVAGNYVTLDLRYFFHADPEKQKRKSTTRRK